MTVSTTSNALARTPAKDIRELLSRPEYERQVKQMLGERAPQFISSVVQVGSQGGLANCDPRSIVAAAIIAATLDLPVDKNLGFSHIIPYGNKAQYQIGYKGIIQLALRSGQYQKLNAKPINAEAFKGYDEVGDPVIDWSQMDETKEPVGYAFAWKLVTGFTKTVYWTKAKVEAHAARYSQAYRSKKMDSPWFTNFNSMALKTVIKDGISHWGIMSIQLQKALVEDQAIHADIDSPIEYPDNEAPSEIRPPALPTGEPKKRLGRPPKALAAPTLTAPPPEAEPPPPEDDVPMQDPDLV